MISEEIAHIKGIPKKLIIFLHGYIDSCDALNKKLSVLMDEMDNYAIHIPEAPLTCEVYDKKRQWYSMHRFDANDERKTVSTMDECIKIYNRMTLGLDETCNYLMPYIEGLLQEYDLEFKDLYILGFSQGAMVGLYTSLMCPSRIGGCVSFSGILAASKYVVDNYKNPTNVLLLHGDADNLVRFGALPFTKEKLEDIGCKVETFVIDGGNHAVTDAGLKQAVKFVKHCS